MSVNPPTIPDEIRDLFERAGSQPGSLGPAEAFGRANGLETTQAALSEINEMIRGMGDPQQRRAGLGAFSNVGRAHAALEQAENKYKNRKQGSGESNAAYATVMAVLAQKILEAAEEQNSYIKDFLDMMDTFGFDTRGIRDRLGKTGIYREFNVDGVSWSGHLNTELSSDWPKGVQFTGVTVNGRMSRTYTFMNDSGESHSITKSGGTAAWRNNNPGNITPGKFASSCDGYLGNDGRFAIFATPEHGLAAMDKLLSTRGYASLSVQGAIHRWCPQDDGRDPMLRGNDPNGYAAQVAGAIGVSTSTPLSILSPEQRRVMTLAMSRKEGWGAGAVSGDTSAPESVANAAAVPKPPRA
jgi:hypothetical protein